MLILVFRKKLYIYLKGYKIHLSSESWEGLGMIFSSYRIESRYDVTSESFFVLGSQTRLLCIHLINLIKFQRFEKYIFASLKKFSIHFSKGIFWNLSISITKYITVGLIRFLFKLTRQNKKKNNHESISFFFYTSIQYIKWLCRVIYMSASN